LQLIGIAAAALVASGFGATAASAAAVSSQSAVSASTTTAKPSPERRLVNSMNVAPSKRSPSANGAVAAVANGCSTAGTQIDPWSIYFQGCVITVPTNVSARCSDGFTLTPIFAQCHGAWTPGGAVDR
jgi:hypothetical protein